MNHGSLFSGIGGFDLAAQWVGWNNIFQVEKEQFCQNVLKKNFPSTKRYGDIYGFKGNTTKKYRGAIDVISGGFPCQPFSVAGKQKGTKDDRYLWPEMLRVIQEINPAWVVAENVTGFVSLGLNKTVSDLENFGYEVQTFIIPACAVGAWHRRDRVWIIAHSNRKSKSNGTIDEKRLGTYPDGKRLERKMQPKKQLAKYSGWTIEPNVGRVANGVPQRVDRLKSLGNAIVPQVVYEIFRLIDKIDGA